MLRPSIFALMLLFITASAYAGGGGNIPSDPRRDSTLMYVPPRVEIPREPREEFLCNLSKIEETEAQALEEEIKESLSSEQQKKFSENTPRYCGRIVLAYYRNIKQKIQIKAAKRAALVSD